MLLIAFILSHGSAHLISMSTANALCWRITGTRKMPMFGKPFSFLKAYTSSATCIYLKVASCALVHCIPPAAYCLHIQSLSPGFCSYKQLTLAGLT